MMVTLMVDGAMGARGDGIGNSLLVALYDCITFIYGSSWKGEMVSEAKRSLDKSSKGSEKVFPGRGVNDLSQVEFQPKRARLV
ncbi:hypothetical protein Tco_1389131 [Tanacetum coccineum]